MDKKNLVKAIQKLLEADLAALIASALATYEAATNEESKPENEYDTRALEASYLAGAQSKRAGEIEESLAAYKNIEIRDFSTTDAIASTALIQVECNGKESWIFLMPKGGGIVLHHEGKPIQVVTPNSPLGEALLGLKEGDVAIVEAGARTREYDIISLS